MSEGKYMGEVGLWTGLLDRHGVEIHLGDTLIFDEQEWGAPYPANEFVIEFKDGQLLTKGVVSELRHFCTVTRKFDGRMLTIDGLPSTKEEADRLMLAIATVSAPIVANGNPFLQRLLDQKKGRSTTSPVPSKHE
jgi:hypothetical protein